MVPDPPTLLCASGTCYITTTPPPPAPFSAFSPTNSHNYALQGPQLDPQLMPSHTYWMLQSLNCILQLFHKIEMIYTCIYIYNIMCTQWHTSNCFLSLSSSILSLAFLSINCCFLSSAFILVLYTSILYNNTLGLAMQTKFSMSNITQLPVQYTQVEKQTLNRLLGGGRAWHPLLLHAVNYAYLMSITCILLVG